MTTTMDIARERQLDWLLDEVLGGDGERQMPARSRSQRGFSWAAAALVLLAIGVAFGVAWLRGEPTARSAQQPQEPAWTECHGASGIDQVPADVTALRCFDFDDDACRRLAKFTKLERLDLSGMDVDDRGVSRSLSITDAGVHELKALVNLRWLCLAQCEQWKGASLHVLEAMPRLEHLDLTYSGVQSPGVERLQRLPSLRTLVLSHCMHFHGDSLRSVAKIPGLRRLELRACTTIAAKDALHLVQLKELRHLDLRDCQGRFRGQTIEFPTSLVDTEPGDPSDPNAPPFLDTDGDGLPDQRALPAKPVQDGIGITDAVIEAVAALPLETLLLGGSESLTDAIGNSLAQLTTLRALDLSNLPKTTGALMAKVPADLQSLRLDHNEHWNPADFARLPPLPKLHTLGLSGSPIAPTTLVQLLAGKELRSLALGGHMWRVKGEPKRIDAQSWQLPEVGAAKLVDDRMEVGQVLDAIAQEHTLEILDFENLPVVSRELLAAVAKLPKLHTLDLTGPHARPSHDRSNALPGLADSRSIRTLRLGRSRLTADAVMALRDLPLQELDLYSTDLKADAIRDLAKHWPGCAITLPNGQRFRAP